MALSLKENIARVRKLPRDSAVLMARAELLAPGDKDLMEAILLRGQTVASVARMMGVTARAVSNRAKRLAARMTSRRFLDAARALPYLDDEDAKLASMKFCGGMSERSLAEKTGLSPHVVRRRLDRITAKITMIRNIQQASGQTGRLPAGGLHQQWRGLPRRSK